VQGMFEKVQTAPGDAILGLTEQFGNDPNPAKINLGVGVYKNGDGNTPIFGAVKQAEQRILAAESSKDYLGIDGMAEYGPAVQGLLFGGDHEVVASGRGATAQTPGGTGALRVAAEFVRKMLPGARVWLSEPTWANHANVFGAAGVEMRTYPYFDAEANDLAFEKMLAALEQVPAGDAVLLHACCHNPTGVDPTPQQWSQIAEVIRQRRLLPVMDFAYQGLGDGLCEDAAGLLAMCRPGCEMLVTNSFSKNFGLYNERVGALTAVAASRAAAEAVLSQIKKIIRAMYSNPPAHGAAIVATVLNDPELRRQWQAEVDAMRERIHKMRRLFVETLKAQGVRQDFSFIIRQRGMFSYSGLTPQQVETLRQKHSIYVVGSGRINVAGMTEANMDRLCQAIAEVL